MRTAGTVEKPPQVDRDDWRFLSINIGRLKAFKKKDATDDVDRYYISGTASSSVEDLYGDTLTEKCQASMLAQASNHLTMWLNHDYMVPEDIAGACAEAQLKNATAEDGTQCLDLDIVMEVDPENPRALKAWQHVNRGITLGFSIGGFFVEYELVYDDENDWWGHFIVDNILLLEISLVGIPANPRAYTKTFEKARAAVVAHAEQIVKDARDQSLSQKRILIRKSFGLAEPRRRNVDPCIKCLALANGDKCEEHREVPATRKGVIEGGVCKGCVVGTKETPDPEVVLGVHDPNCDKYVAPRTVKAVDDPSQQSQVVEAMKCIQRCVNSPGHALCAEPDTHARTAHTILKSMLPDDYDTPEDANLSAPTIAVALSVDVTAEQKAALADVIAQVETAKAELANLSAEIETSKTAKAELEQKIATLKGTPTGRSTKDTRSGGSSNGSETSVPASAYY